MHHALQLFLALGALLVRTTASYSLPVQNHRQGQQHVLQAGQASTVQEQRPPQQPISPFKHRSNGFQTGFVALGDSYSAGIGTGFLGKEDDCRHGLGAYPQLIANDLAASQHGSPNITSAQLLACTGATTQQVLAGGEDSQIDKLNTSLPTDFALLSLGGNDLGFFEVMNSCVFRFYSFYSGTCETALEHSRAALESDEFAVRLEITITEILDAVRWEKKPWFFITMTGYARFFDATTEACDDMSFGVWWNGPRLTRELRARMNDLVLAVNNKIRYTVGLINAKFSTDKVLFVDHDDLWDGHRFCESGVVEPDYERGDTWFFLVGGADNARNGTNGTSTGISRNTGGGGQRNSPTALVDPATCLEPAQRSGDWGAQALCYMAMAKQRDPSLRPSPAMERVVLPLSRDAFLLPGREDDEVGDGDVLAGNSMWYVPTYYGKTFHPRTRGHEAIRDAVYRAWREMEEA
ncbi:SGNH hydrolase-type esterase domain-containing protein [Microdochium trichocladiopsis]|uniref:SGNH hydrolase-type esterase domain-containing protein n=1 Tax=Microdochium trichocladiopsis TaxID=1682393 RepID=A0A9P8YJQ6_9PEZI|nr:SGNH hydrolase-type esterase domain-containing protein [Microdochium trichocladiopsis]KAH7041273.1 SGNH hydrolase-type esterase domain-containing protein [Microdochium trichocladiopsis]